MSFIDDMNNWLKESNEISESLNKLFPNSHSNKKYNTTNNFQSNENKKEEDIISYDNSYLTTAIFPMVISSCDC